MSSTGGRTARHQEAQRCDSRVIHPRPVPQARAAAGCSTREAAAAEATVVDTKQRLWLILIVTTN